MLIPDDLLFTEEHEWIRDMGGSKARIGITDYAQDQLGDVVFVGLPEVGLVVAKDDVLVEVESTKSVGEVYAPFPGEVTAINQAVSDQPELVNQSPYEAWLVELTVEGGIPADALLDPAAYRELTE
jgi:glycine cleavage system H protein